MYPYRYEQCHKKDTLFISETINPTNKNVNE